MEAKATPLFDPKAFLTRANGGKTILQYQVNKIIFSRGDLADAIFYIKNGRVKKTVSEQGKEAVISVLGPDEFFGAGCLVGQPRRIATATTMTECEIVRLDKKATIRILHDEPSFSDLFISHLLAHTIRVEEDLVDQLFNSGEKRLARALLRMADLGEEGGPDAVVPKVSQVTLAGMIGTTRSRVSHFMNKFRKLGLIDYNGQLKVHRSLSVVLLDQARIRR